MALFGSLMRDLDSDPFFGLARALEPGGLRQMEAMMEGMLGPMLGAFPGFAGARRSASLGAFPALDDLFSATGAQQQPPAQCHSFSSSSVVTMTTDEHGQPQVYQASQCTRTAPGGVKETRRSLQDSRTGLQELTIGHHLDDRAHIVGRKRNRRTGDEDHSVHYVNLDEAYTQWVNTEMLPSHAVSMCINACSTHRTARTRSTKKGLSTAEQQHHGWSWRSRRTAGAGECGVHVVLCSHATKSSSTGKEQGRSVEDVLRFVRTQQCFYGARF
ncbi:myeloid leukemia factor 2-like isoform X3 [Haemaphysalis longicornis]